MAEVVTFDKEDKIIIISSRRIPKGEEVGARKGAQKMSLVTCARGQDPTPVAGLEPATRGGRSTSRGAGG